MSLQSMFARAELVRIGADAGSLQDGRAFLNRGAGLVLGGMGSADTPTALVQTSAHAGITRGWRLEVVASGEVFSVRSNLAIDDGQVTELQLSKESS